MKAVAQNLASFDNLVTKIAWRLRDIQKKTDNFLLNRVLVHFNSMVWEKIMNIIKEFKEWTMSPISKIYIHVYKISINNQKEKKFPQNKQV